MIRKLYALMLLIAIAVVVMCLYNLPIFLTDSSKESPTEFKKTISENVQTVFRHFVQNKTSANRTQWIFGDLRNNATSRLFRKPIITLFTTFKNDPKRYDIHVNTLYNWACFQPYVNLVLFDYGTDDKLVKLAQKLGWHILSDSRIYGLPKLKELYTRATSTFNSTFYGYSNGDVLYNDGLLYTLSAVAHRLPALGRTLIIGQRTNYDTTAGEFLFQPEQIQQVATLKGKPFIHDAEDYFFIAHNEFIWNSIPDVVIGRPGYDNFIVAKAIKAGISVIDATKTLIALHQTGKDGNYAGHQHVDKDVNWKLIGEFQYANGIIAKAQYETVFNNKRQLEVWHRITKRDPRLFKVEIT